MTLGMQLEEAARLEEELRHYRELFEGAPDGYALTDAHGTIREGNRALTAMLGVHSRFLGRKLLVSFVARRDVKRFQAWLLRLAQGEDDGEIVSLSLRPRDARPPFVADLASRVVRGTGGRVTSIRWGVRKARGEIIPTVTHDLHSLIQAVHAAGAALACELANGPPGALALLGEIQSTSAHMLHLTGRSADSSSVDGEGRAFTAGTSNDVNDSGGT